MEPKDPVDRLVDEAAHQMMAAEPSTRFVADVMARIGTDERSASAGAGFRRAPRLAAWHVAMAGALALLVVVLTLSRPFEQRQPTPADTQAARPQGVLPETAGSRRSTDDARQQAEADSSSARAAVNDLASGSTSTAVEPLPELPPIEPDPIVVEAIALAPIEMAAIEFAPVGIGPFAIEPLDIGMR